MHSSFSPRRVSPLCSAPLLLAAVLISGWAITPNGFSQAPAASTPNAALAVMLSKLKAQQQQIVANQAKIEAQTALLKEEVRQAKIYSARGGAGRR